MKSIYQSLGALAVLGLSATTHAGDMVPFRGHGSATGTIEPLGADVAEVDLNILLQATHLGRSTGTATYLLNVTTLTFDGTFSVTASNGKNTVNFSAMGQLTPVPGSTCLFNFEQTFTVTGGTGAFANATGGGTSTGQFSTCEAPVVSVIDATFTGTISRPNS